MRNGLVLIYVHVDNLHKQDIFDFCVVNSNKRVKQKHESVRNEDIILD